MRRRAAAANRLVWVASRGMLPAVLSYDDVTDLLRLQAKAYELLLWELDRRARNKGKGPVAHRLWRSLPADTKRALTADQVWAARRLILRAAGG